MGESVACEQALQLGENSTRKETRGTARSRVLLRLASHAINGKLASRLGKVAIYWKYLEERTGERLLRNYNYEPCSKGV